MVEHHLAKVRVAGSNPVSRSNNRLNLFLQIEPFLFNKHIQELCFIRISFLVRQQISITRDTLQIHLLIGRSAQ